MTPKFYGQVLAGKLTIFKGENVQLTVGKVKGLRTEQQMRYYWGVVVKLIADYTGNDTETIHEFLKDKFAPRKVITIKEEARTVAGCTHDLFKENFFEDYVDHIRVWAAHTLQLVIPDPHQVDM